MIPDFLVVGHVTKDILTGGFRAGGTALYAAFAAFKLGARTAMITSAGPDLNVSQIFRERGGSVQVHVVPSKHTTTFENIYSPTGRDQFLRAVASPLRASDVPKTWLEAPLVLLGPVAQEVDPAMVRCFPRAIVATTPQGWMRRWDESGRVSHTPWKEMEGAMPHFHAIILSEEDAPEEEIASLTSKTSILVVTGGNKGARVHFSGRWSYIRAFPAEERDPTGAGDVFASAFLIRYAETRDPWVSALFASCTASFAVEDEGTSSIPSRAQVEERLSRSQGT